VVDDDDDSNDVADDTALDVSLVVDVEPDAMDEGIVVSLGISIVSVGITTEFVPWCDPPSAWPIIGSIETLDGDESRRLLSKAVRIRSKDDVGWNRGMASAKQE
jgi:hypothetical protein